MLFVVCTFVCECVCGTYVPSTTTIISSLEPMSSHACVVHIKLPILLCVSSIKYTHMHTHAHKRIMCYGTLDTHITVASTTEQHTHTCLRDGNLFIFHFYMLLLPLFLVCCRNSAKNLKFFPPKWNLHRKIMGKAITAAAVISIVTIPTLAGRFSSTNHIKLSLKPPINQRIKQFTFNGRVMVTVSIVVIGAAIFAGCVNFRLSKKIKKSKNNIRHWTQTNKAFKM